MAISVVSQPVLRTNEHRFGFLAGTFGEYTSGTQLDLPTPADDVPLASRASEDHLERN